MKPTPDYMSLLSQDLNDGQRAAFNAKERLAVVPACPGSGKTRLFVSVIARELLAKRGGIAALSFTNVAEKEVRGRLNEITGGVTHPHFIGTIDAFLFRYVVKPFGGQLVDLARFSHPADSKDFFAQADAIPGLPAGSKLIDANVLRRDRRTSIYHKGSLLDNDQIIADVKRMKREAWKRGILTHDDICCVAALLLEDEGIKRIVLSRFPILLVDEFQDTGGSREDALISLLKDEQLVHGLVVGDPDQCIMQFNHARPDLFDDVLKLPGAKRYPLEVTHRFHKDIADVALHLSGAFDTLDTSPKNIRTGYPSTLLLFHDIPYSNPDLTQISESFASFIQHHALSDPNKRPALLAWHERVVRRFRGGAFIRPDFNCRWLQLLFEANQLFCSADIADAYKKAERVLSDGRGFEGSLPTTLMLKEQGLTRQAWKRAVWDLLQASRPSSDEETVTQWIARLKEELKAPFSKVSADLTRIPSKIQFRRSSLGTVSSKSISSLLNSDFPDGASNFQIEKVHQVKGREFPAVCFFVPKSKVNEPGIQESWFSDKAIECARVAYVAITRAEEALMLVVPRDWYEELSTFEKGRHFISSFKATGSISSYLNGDLNPEEGQPYAR